MSENDRIANPYEVLGSNIDKLSLLDRLRQYAHFKQDSGEGRVAVDLFEAVRALDAISACPAPQAPPA